VLPRARTVAPAVLLGLTVLTALILPSTTGAVAAPPPVAARFAGPSTVNSTESSGAVAADPTTLARSSGVSVGSSGVSAVPTLAADGLVLRRRLSWSPPALTAPITVAVGSSSATVRLNNARDYVLRLPAVGAAVRPAGLVISGGHNVVLIGGSVDVAGGVRLANGQVQRRALYLKGQTGTVFIEGVEFFSRTTGSLTEGIDLDERLGATVVLQNIRLGRLVGSRSTNHADGVQTWAGPDRLLIDGLSFQTQYQGMFLLPNQQFKKGPAPHLFDLRNISIIGEPGSGYLLWRDRQMFPWRLTNVNVRPGSHKLTARGLFLWDPLGTFATVRAVEVVPPVVSICGTGYRSPGYAGRL
jgi:hypothetical protein